MPRATSLASSRLEDLEEACITAADGGRDCSCSATNTCRFLLRLSRWTKSLSSLLLIFLFSSAFTFSYRYQDKSTSRLKRNGQRWISICNRNCRECFFFSFFLFFRVFLRVQRKSDFCHETATKRRFFFLNIGVANGNGEKTGRERFVVRIPVVGINFGEWPERISGTGDTRHERRRKGAIMLSTSK